MIICDAQATAARLPYAPLAEAVAGVLRAKRAGTAQAPERLTLRLRPADADGGCLLCMPAADADVAVTKLITVHAGNRRAGLPVIQGEMTVLDARTGRRLLLLDGATVTSRRTAAVSVLAMRTLAPRPHGARGPLLLIGAGVQGLAHVEACREVLGVERLYVHSRSLASAEAVAAHGRSLGMESEAVADLLAVLPACPLIVTATTSPAPVLSEAACEAIREDACIVAVGSFHPDEAELPASLMRRARVVVDSLEAARTEAGDILLAGLDWAGIAALEDCLEAWPPAQEGPVVFKSVGCAYFDLAAGRVAAGK